MAANGAAPHGKGRPDFYKNSIEGFSGYCDAGARRQCRA
jgi:hypothetical protein